MVGGKDRHPRMSSGLHRQAMAHMLIFIHVNVHNIYIRAGKEGRGDRAEFQQKGSFMCKENGNPIEIRDIQVQGMGALGDGCSVSLFYGCGETP